MKTTAKTAVTQDRHIQISLKIDSDSAFQKLTKANSSIPSWVLGEEIAKRLDKGRRNIEINLSNLFLAHQV